MSGDELTEGLVRIDPSSPLYQEVARLYRLAHELHPGGEDLWNEKLYARTDDKWGGLDREGTLRLNQQLVLDHLTGGSPSHDPQLQGQALVTVLHESLHARVKLDALHEPNAVRAPQSVGLDEGLTELASMEAYDDFVRRAGYDGAPKPQPEYAGAVHAADALLRRASNSPAERKELLQKALNQPVVMRWDTIADHIVRNQLGHVVPPTPEHQAAARAHLVNQMAVAEWSVVQNRPQAGQLTADLTVAGIDRAVADLQTHYQQRPGEPFQAKIPNPSAAVAAPELGEHRRAVSRTDRSDRFGPEAMRRILAASAPAAGATGERPVLGDGRRGAGSPSTGHRPGPARETDRTR
jgi:hypothetical protein